MVVADTLRAQKEDFCGFIDAINPQQSGEGLVGLPIWASIQQAIGSCDYTGVEIAIGFGHCVARARLIKALDEMGVRLRTVIDARASVSPTATIGRGAYIAQGAIIEAKCRIGDGAIVNTASVICHEVVIGQAVDRSQ